jgi:hypothetical protein
MPDTLCRALCFFREWVGCCTNRIERNRPQLFFKKGDPLKGNAFLYILQINQGLINNLIQ